MSWQAYVDDQMVATGFVDKGAIFGVDGSQWAITPGFAISPEEAAAITTAANTPSTVLGGGLTLQGHKYMILRADDSAIYGRKGNLGFCVVKTNQAVLLGHFGENVQPGQCNVVVEKLGDYLKENGY
ncbi:profilin-1B [Baffinella frigidus]|nr:profilin-1B [Cryptophyta sp. CCMP2293]